MKKFIFSLLLFLIISSSFSSFVFAIDYPASQGPVSDFANLLSSSQKDQIKSDLIKFENQTTIEFAVVTVNSLNGASVEEYTTGLGNSWGVGKKNQNNGIILLVALTEHKVRISFGGGLNNQDNVTFSQGVINDIIIPEFKNGNMDQGIISGVNAIIRNFSPKSRSTESSSEPASVSSGPDFQMSKAAMLTILFVLISIVVLIILILLIRFFIKNNNLKKENQNKLKKSRQKLFEITSTYLDVQSALQELQKKYTQNIWIACKEDFDKLDLRELQADLEAAEFNCNNRPLTQSKVESSIESIDSEIASINRVYDRILRKDKEMLAAQSQISNLLKSIPICIENASETIAHEDVSLEVKNEFDQVKSEYSDLKNTYESLTASELDYPEFSNNFVNIQRQLKNIESKAISEIDLTKKARIEGPAMLAKMPELIKKLEDQNLHSSKASRLLSQARSEYEKAQSMSNSSNFNWLMIYMLLNNANDHCDQAVEAHERYVAESNSNWDSNSSSSTWSSDSTSFSGGSGFSDGGGSSGSW